MNLDQVIETLKPEFKTRFLVFTQLSNDSNWIAHSEVYYTKEGAKYQKQVMQVMGYEQVEVVEIKNVN